MMRNSCLKISRKIPYFGNFIYICIDSNLYDMMVYES